MNEQNSSKSVNNWMLRQDLILVMLKKKMQPDIRLWFIVQWEDFQNIFGHVVQLFPISFIFSLKWLMTQVIIKLLEGILVWKH